MDVARIGNGVTPKGFMRVEPRIVGFARNHDVLESVSRVQQELAALLRDARCVLAWRADFDARVLGRTAAVHNLAVPPIEWADVRPAYVDARPKGPHSLADAMRRERLAWEGRHHRAETDCRAVLALMRRMGEEAG